MHARGAPTMDARAEQHEAAAPVSPRARDTDTPAAHEAQRRERRERRERIGAFLVTATRNATHLAPLTPDACAKLAKIKYAVWQNAQQDSGSIRLSEMTAHHFEGAVIAALRVEIYERFPHQYEVRLAPRKYTPLPEERCTVKLSSDSHGCARQQIYWCE